MVAKAELRRAALVTTQTAQDRVYAIMVVMKRTSLTGPLLYFGPEIWRLIAGRDEGCRPKRPG